MKKSFIVSIFLAIYAQISYAEDNVVTQASYSKESRFFKYVGKSYIAKKDNEWVINRYGENFFKGVHVFLNTPLTKYYALLDSSTSPKNDRKYILKDTKFVIESVVSPSELEAEAFRNKKVDCKHEVVYCYFKFKFEDGSYGYMKVGDFDTVSNPALAVGFNAPWLLQIIDLSPGKSWKKYKAEYDKHFRKLGVIEGLTQEQVLKSSWGKPMYKTRSSDVEIWTYDTGMLTFEKGYLTSFTTVY